MQHLPVIQGRRIQGLESVPYVCEIPYDQGPFLTYPNRVGRPQALPDTTKVGRQIPFWQYEMLHPTPVRELEDFLLTWLFFGLIHELLGDFCKPVDFIRVNQSDGSKSISTSRLNGNVEQWISSIKNGSCLMTYAHITECLQSSFQPLRAAGPEFDLRIKVCIASVCEQLTLAVNIAFGLENASIDQFPATRSLLIDKSVYIEHLSGSGWCPSVITMMMRSSLSLQALHFFASMESIPAATHELCDEKRCVGYQTNLKDYLTQHVDKDCPCEHLYIDVAKLEDTIMTGGLALLRIRESENLNNVTVELVESRPDSYYLALSHVWADGLGNPKANALPRCQVLRLSKLTRILGARPNASNRPTELLLWCDTLCCPAQPGKAKNRVLAQMKSIYEEATCVLVLDASLQVYESDSMSAEEICARIIASGWTRRLWTLQEGALPADKGRLWFQFHDKAVRLNSVWRELLQIYNTDPSRRGLVGTLISRLRTFATFFYRETTGVGSDLHTLDTALQYRSVSVSSDEPLLIATLLGLNVTEILNASENESEESRFQRVWSAMPAAVGGLTKDILFRLGPRLKEPGYRWAPSTMLFHEDSNTILHTLVKEDAQGILTKHGLKARFSGYHILFPRPLIQVNGESWDLKMSENIFYIREDTAQWYGVVRRSTSHSGDFLSTEKISNLLSSQADLWIAQLDTEFQALANGAQQPSIALLMKLTKEEDDIKYAESHMHLYISPLTKVKCEMYEAAYQSAQQLAMSATIERLAHVMENELGTESSEYKTACDAVEKELAHIIASEPNRAATDFARKTSVRHDDVFFTALVKMTFLGHYAIMGPRTPKSQQWCVD